MSSNYLEKTLSNSKKDPASFLEKIIGPATKSGSTFALRISASTTSDVGPPFLEPVTPQPSLDTQTDAKQVFMKHQRGRSHHRRQAS